MSAKATFTIVTSRKLMNTATEVTIRTFHCRCMTQRTVAKLSCVTQLGPLAFAPERSASAYVRQPGLLGRPRARGDRRPLDDARDPRRLPRRAPLRGPPARPRRGAQRPDGPPGPARGRRHPGAAPLPGEAGALRVPPDRQGRRPVA